jgi:hypothetical protein
MVPKLTTHCESAVPINVDVELFDTFGTVPPVQLWANARSLAMSNVNNAKAKKPNALLIMIRPSHN